jgi:hypothetical protein
MQNEMRVRVRLVKEVDVNDNVQSRPSKSERYLAKISVFFVRLN